MIIALLTNLVSLKIKVSKDSSFLKNYKIEKRENEKEGQSITDYVMKEKISEFLTEEYNLFFIVDTVFCPSCLNFYIKKIKNLSIKNINVYSPKNFEYIKSYISSSKEIILEENNKNKLFLLDNLATMIVNKAGVILYYEIANKSDYEKSEKFYSKVKNLMKN